MNKYPKHGGDCEYTMDCPWGVDGWCDRPSDSKCELQKMDDARAAEACEAEKARAAGTKEINEFMETRISKERCPCGGKLTQTRSGSFRAKCGECEKIWQLGGRKR